MTSDWRASVCQAAGTARLQQVAAYVCPRQGGEPSPIDAFYRQIGALMRAGGPATLTQHPVVGPLLFVGVVSATENYFRDIFAGIIRLCPVARSRAGAMDIKLGSVLWHGPLEVERGAFEFLSFASAENITKTSQKFLGYQFKASGATVGAMGSFELICEFRHCIAHAGAALGGKNAVRLGLPSGAQPQQVNVGFAELQECADVCTALVAAANRELFEEMCRRFAKEWPREASYQSARDYDMFKDIWSLFRSEEDAAGGRVAADATCRKVYNRVIADLR